MPLNPFAKKRGDACRVHSGHAASGNGMLIAMLMVAAALIVWHVRVYGPTNNPLLPLEKVGFPALLAMEIEDLLFSNSGILAELWEVFPYFLAGVLIGGWLRTFKVAVKLQASLRKYGVMSVFLASLVGIITPLCACGTLTTAISLLFAGIPLAPVMALMVTSPLMSPSTYLLTLNDLGPEWTVIRTLSAFSMGIFAGLITHFLARRGILRKGEIFTEGGVVRGDFHDEDYPDERLRCNCRRKFGNRVAVRTGNKLLIFLAKSAEMLWVVGKYVIVGVVIGKVVERYLPSEWIYNFFGRKGPLDIVWVTLASVPVFLHQISASSIIYHIKGSLGGTMDGAAALAFMIGGPVTAVPTMVLFWTFFRKRVFFLYMALCLSGTILIAYGSQIFFFTPGVDLGNPLLRGVASLSGGSSTAIVKTGPHVRMVMDPAGKGIIATSSNDLDGSGGVVFDVSTPRFAIAGEESFDNLRYIENIASWLEQNSGSVEAKNILVYSTRQRAGNNRGGLVADSVLAELGKNGYNVRTVARGDSPAITDSILSGCGQLWLFMEEGERLSDAEIETIKAFNAGGGGALLVAGASLADAVEASRVSSLFGVRFTGTAENGREIPVSASAVLLDRGSKWLGVLLRMVHKA